MLDHFSCSSSVGSHYLRIFGVVFEACDTSALSYSILYVNFQVMTDPLCCVEVGWRTKMVFLYHGVLVLLLWLVCLLRHSQ